MGSMISLGVGRMEIDWGKNNFFRNHSALFQTSDVKMIPYYYVDDDGNPLIVEKEGYSRQLKLVKPRLDLLGYTLEMIEEKYNQLRSDCLCHGIKNVLSYETFSKILKEIDVRRINTPELAAEYDEYGYDFGEFVRRCIIPEKEIHQRLLDAVDGDEFELRFGLEEFFENMDPYIILRLLAENESCRELDVFWSFSDVVEGGWVEKEDIVIPLSDEQKILIVTEGSSDSFIIKRTIDTLYPEICDFFNFIDMQENYPFTGTGNLYNFCCGLMKIGVLNQIIVLFDNDVAGNEKYEKLVKMPHMKNLLIAKLPYLTSFENIDTIGPQGVSVSNINGVAVAIECFLDLNSCERTPLVRWTNFVDKAEKYQGALIAKDEYVRSFKNADIVSDGYDSSKLRFLIDYLLVQWCTTR